MFVLRLAFIIPFAPTRSHKNYIQKMPVICEASLSLLEIFFYIGQISKKILLYAKISNYIRSMKSLLSYCVLEYEKEIIVYNSVFKSVLRPDTSKVLVYSFLFILLRTAILQSTTL